MHGSCLSEDVSALDKYCSLESDDIYRDMRDLEFVLRQCPSYNVSVLSRGKWRFKVRYPELLCDRESLVYYMDLPVGDRKKFWIDFYMDWFPLRIVREGRLPDEAIHNILNIFKNANQLTDEDIHRRQLEKNVVYLRKKNAELEDKVEELSTELCMARATLKIQDSELIVMRKSKSIWLDHHVDKIQKNRLK